MFDTYVDLPNSPPVIISPKTSTDTQNYTRPLQLTIAILIIIIHNALQSHFEILALANPSGKILILQVAVFATRSFAATPIAENQLKFS